MTGTEAIAEVFIMALRGMPRAARDAVIARLARDRAFVRDLLDLAVIDKRREEQSRPFREYLEGR